MLLCGQNVKSKQKRQNLHFLCLGGEKGEIRNSFDKDSWCQKSVQACHYIVETNSCQSDIKMVKKLIIYLFDFLASVHGK